MVCASEIQIEQHDALSCLLPTFSSSLQIDANKISEPCWRSLETQKHKLWNNSLLPVRPHRWKQAEILSSRGIGIDTLLVIVMEGL